MRVLRGIVDGDPVALGMAIGAVIAATGLWFVISRRRRSRQDLG